MVNAKPGPALDNKLVVMTLVCELLSDILAALLFKIPASKNN